MGMALADAAAAADGLALDSAGFGTRAGAGARHARAALRRDARRRRRRPDLVAARGAARAAGGPRAGGLLGLRPMPEKLGRGDATALLREDLSKSIQTTRNYIQRSSCAPTATCRRARAMRTC